jgi:hypothetical protein
MASLGSYNFAVREAARVGSVEGRTNPNVDQDIINAVTSRVQGLVMAQMTEIDIYKADPLDGSCYDSQSASWPVDNAVCMKDLYYENGAGPAHSLCTAQSIYCLWPPDVRNDSLANADYVGVRVLYKYTFLTSFFAAIGTVLNLSTTSVQRIEPQDYQGVQVPAIIALRASGVSAGLRQAGLPPAWKQEDGGGSG